MTNNLINTHEIKKTSNGTNQPSRNEFIAKQQLLDVDSLNIPVINEFLDHERNTIDIQGLLTAYIQLKAVQKQNISPNKALLSSNVDENAVTLDGTSDNTILAFDESIVHSLLEAGLSQEQVQIIKGIASDRILPMISEIASYFEAAHQLDKVINYFGGEDQWLQASKQLRCWSSRSLPPRVKEALSTTSEGILTMYKMMSAGEPSIFSNKNKSISSTISETDLKTLMKDPRYWRDQEPSVVEKVRNGFKHLYGN